MQCRLEVAAELQPRWRGTNRRRKSIPRSSSSHREGSIIQRGLSCIASTDRKWPTLDPRAGTGNSCMHTRNQSCSLSSPRDRRLGLETEILRSWCWRIDLGCFRGRSIINIISDVMLNCEFGTGVPYFWRNATQCRINADRGPWQLFAWALLLTRDKHLSHADSHSSRYDMLAIISPRYQYGPFLFFVAEVMSNYLTIDRLIKIFYSRRPPPWGLRPVAFATSATWLVDIFL